MPEWTFTDAWILAATSFVHRSDGAALSEIVATADAINHAIPTAGELSRSLSRLANSGIVESVDGKFRLSTKSIRGVRKAMAKRGGLFKSAEKCLVWLRNAGGPSDMRSVTITQSEVTNAYRVYLKALGRPSKRARDVGRSSGAKARRRLG